MKLRSFYCVASAFNLLLALPFVVPAKQTFAMVGSYIPVSCSYNKTLQGKGFYLILSWDTDNALAYMFNNRLIMNKGAAIYRKALAENFNVDRKQDRQEMVLTIQHVRMDYQDLRVICIVKDDEGRGAVVWKFSTTLKVIDPPRILRFASNVINVTLDSLKRVELICAAAGYPEPYVQWRKRYGGKLVEAQKFDRKSLTARCFLPTPVTLDVAGTYLCEATTRHEYMEEIGLNTAVSGVLVNVQYPPEIKVKERVIYTDIGQPVSITIEVSGNPRPTLQCSLFDIRAPKLMRVRDLPTDHRYRYDVVLKRMQAAFISDYPCRATNRVGSDTTMIRLRLGPSRPRILSSETTDYSDYYALKWTVMSMARLHNSTVELSRRNSSGNVVPVRVKFIPLLHLDRRSPSSINQTFLYHVTNLTADSMYVVRVRTCNRHKCSDFSSPVVFKTRRFNGRNKADRSIYDRSSATHRPSNIRSVRTCRTYALGRAGCTAPSLPFSPLLLCLSLLLAFRPLLRLLD